MGVAATEERVGSVTLVPPVSAIEGVIGWGLIGSGTIGNPASGAHRDLTVGEATSGTLASSLEH
jgi:hypothetical protein